MAWGCCRFARNEAPSDPDHRIQLGFGSWLCSLAAGEPKTPHFGSFGGFGGQIDASPQHPPGLDGGLVVAGLALLHHRLEQFVTIRQRFVSML